MFDTLSNARKILVILLVVLFLGILLGLMMTASRVDGYAREPAVQTPPQAPAKQPVLPKTAQVETPEIKPQDQLRPPALQLLIASADIQRITPDFQKHIRYLDLGNTYLEQRETDYRILSGHIQHISRSPLITQPQIVPGTLGSLLRINIKDYLIDEKTWEQLADADPYYHQGGKAAFWTVPSGLHEQAMAVLEKATGSKVPIVRADWFFSQSAAQEGRRPGYYDFLGLKNQTDYEKLIGFEKDKRSFAVRFAVKNSGVTLQPRAGVRYQTFFGSYWKSIDFKRAVGEQNPLRSVGQQIEDVADGYETFGYLPNGFWATAAMDNKDNLLPSAPDFVASDHQSKSNDSRVHVNVSCMRCHTNGGLRDVDDYIRKLRPSLSAELLQEYGPPLEPIIEQDRQRFNQAVKLATGLNSKDYTRLYAAYWERYEDVRVDLKKASLDTGIDEKSLRLAIQQSGDPLLADLLGNGSIPIRQWEDVYPTVQTLFFGTAEENKP